MKREGDLTTAQGESLALFCDGVKVMASGAKLLIEQLEQFVNLPLLATAAKATRVVHDEGSASVALAFPTREDAFAFARAVEAAQEIVQPADDTAPAG